MGARSEIAFNDSSHFLNGWSGMLLRNSYAVCNVVHAPVRVARRSSSPTDKPVKYEQATRP